MVDYYLPPQASETLNCVPGALKARRSRQLCTQKWLRFE